MKTCKTCKYWDADSVNPLRRECSLLSDMQNVLNDPPPTSANAIDYSSHEYGTFSTGPDFGCIHHASK